MIKLAMILDDVERLNPKKDSSLAMLLEAESRGYEVYCLQQEALFFKDKEAYATTRRITISSSALPSSSSSAKAEDPKKLSTATGPSAFAEGDDGRASNDSERTSSASTYLKAQLDTEIQTLKLSDFDMIFMRKDPPFNIDYIYTTYFLSHAKAAGTLVVNDPQSLRDANEKFFITQFPNCIPTTLISMHPQQLKDFVGAELEVILKPLDGMGGRDIFKVTPDDPNLPVIIDYLTAGGKRQIMAQRFIPAIKQGDKRILLIDGEPIPYALARIPAAGEIRGNLAAGASYEGRELTVRDRELYQRVGPTLKAMGLLFVGLDVIGDYITEINVTSPTGIRELDRIFDINISATLFDCLEAKLSV